MTTARDGPRPPPCGPPGAVASVGSPSSAVEAIGCTPPPRCRSLVPSGACNVRARPYRRSVPDGAVRVDDTCVTPLGDVPLAPVRVAVISRPIRHLVPLDARPDDCRVALDQRAGREPLELRPPQGCS